MPHQDRRWAVRRLHSLSGNVKAAFRTQLGRVRNRWSTALVRTSGFVLIDLFVRTIHGMVMTLRALLSLVIGRRPMLDDAMRGITVRARRIEKIKEAEFFIYVSLAAAAKAIEYGQECNRQARFSAHDFLREVDGLDFAGAGGLIEDDLDVVQAAIGQARAYA